MLSLFKIFKKTRDGIKIARRAAVSRAAPVLFICVLLSACTWGKPKEEFVLVNVERADFTVYVESTGAVEPLNRVQINPPISGRVDEVIAEAGSRVARGDILAWMSSTERAALLDAARAQGAVEIAYWEDAYKPAAIVAPVSGLIVFRNIVSGQTVSPSTVLFEMSDTLIVRARVDETDIGKLSVGQRARLTIDALPDQRIRGRVRAIDLQSQLVSNVNMYQVELEMDETPPNLRSGMTASVFFIIEDKPDALLVPAWAVNGLENAELEVRVVDGASEATRVIATGKSDGTMIEVLSGVSAGQQLKVPRFTFGRGGGRDGFSPFTRSGRTSGARQQPQQPQQSQQQPQSQGTRDR